MTSDLPVDRGYRKEELPSSRLMFMLRLWLCPLYFPACVGASGFQAGCQIHTKLMSHRLSAYRKKIKTLSVLHHIHVVRCVNLSYVAIKEGECSGDGCDVQQEDPEQRVCPGYTGPSLPVSRLADSFLVNM